MVGRQHALRQARRRTSSSIRASAGRLPRSARCGGRGSGAAAPWPQRRKNGGRQCPRNGRRQFTCACCSIVDKTITHVWPYRTLPRPLQCVCAVDADRTAAAAATTAEAAPDGHTLEARGARGAATADYHHQSRRRPFMCYCCCRSSSWRWSGARAPMIQPAAAAAVVRDGG